MAGPTPVTIDGRVVGMAEVTSVSEGKVTITVYDRDLIQTLGNLTEQVAVDVVVRQNRQAENVARTRTVMQAAKDLNKTAAKDAGLWSEISQSLSRLQMLPGEGLSEENVRRLQELITTGKLVLPASPNNPPRP